MSGAVKPTHEQDIVEQLKAAAWPSDRLWHDQTRLLCEAVDELEAARKERDEAKSACLAMAREIERLKAEPRIRLVEVEHKHHWFVDEDGNLEHTVETVRKEPHRFAKEPNPSSERTE